MPTDKSTPRPTPPPGSQTLLLLPLHKLQRLILPHHDDATALVAQIPHPVALLRHEQHLGPEGGADELAAAGLAGPVGDGPQHVGDGGAVLGVEVGVDFVKEVEGGRVALLDGEDEGEGAEAWGFCTVGQSSARLTYSGWGEGSRGMTGWEKQGGKMGLLFCPPLSCWMRCWSSCLLLKLTLMPTPV